MLKKLLLLSVLSLFMAFAWQSCDIIEPPFIEDAIGTLPPDSLCILEANATDPFADFTYTRKVLLEEFTGHQCGTCPPAGKIALDLQDNVYEGEMVWIAIHAGSLSNFEPDDPKYYTDFTTTVGDELYGTFFPVDAVPFGLVNRIKNSGNGFFLYGKDEWQSAVSKELDKPAEAGIDITNCYNPDDRKVTTVVNVKYITDVTDKEHLSVYLIEDNIIDWQKDYGQADQNVPDYTHHNVFRASFNGTWGTRLSESTVLTDDRFTESYSMEVDSAFDISNCKVVAFLHHYDPSNEIYTLRQVETKGILE